METFSASLPLCTGDPPANGGFPLQRDNKADMFLSCQPEQTVEQKLDWPVIRGAMTVILRRRYVVYLISSWFILTPKKTSKLRLTYGGTGIFVCREKMERKIAKRYECYFFAGLSERMRSATYFVRFVTYSMGSTKNKCGNRILLYWFKFKFFIAFITRQHKVATSMFKVRDKTKQTECIKTNCTHIHERQITHLN